MSKRARSTRGQSSTPKKSRWKKRFGDSECSTMACTKCTMTIVQDASFTPGTSLIRNFSPTMLVREFLASFEFEASAFSIGDGGFNVGNTKVASIRDPKVKLAHRCIATTILGRKESTNKVTKIDLYYLYCIYTEGVVCNIPYWLEKYLREDDEAEEEAGGEAVNEGAGGQHEALANWMYDHTVYELQYLSTPGVKPITLPMATMDTCLQAMHTVLAHPMMALFDYTCLIMLYLMRRSFEVFKKFH
ncbi:hypothetical protein Tco_0513506 [Tanacetum coccineum]